MLHVSSFSNNNLRIISNDLSQSLLLRVASLDRPDKKFASEMTIVVFQQRLPPFGLTFDQQVVVIRGVLDTASVAYPKLFTTKIKDDVKKHFLLNPQLLSPQQSASATVPTSTSLAASQTQLAHLGSQSTPSWTEGGPGTGVGPFPWGAAPHQASPSRQTNRAKPSSGTQAAAKANPKRSSPRTNWLLLKSNFVLDTFQGQLQASKALSVYIQEHLPTYKCPSSCDFRTLKCKNTEVFFVCPCIPPDDKQKSRFQLNLSRRTGGEDQDPVSYDLYWNQISHACVPQQQQQPQVPRLLAKKADGSFGALLSLPQAYLIHEQEQNPTLGPSQQLSHVMDRLQGENKLQFTVPGEREELLKKMRAYQHNLRKRRRDKSSNAV